MDDVAKRREARRRKILENSQHRLNRITGIEQRSDKTILCENHNEINTNFSNIANHVEHPIVANQVQFQETFKETRQPQKQYKKTVISALAIFINLLIMAIQYFKFDTSDSHINKIFLPLLIYEIIYFLSSDNNGKENNSFLHVLLTAYTKNCYLIGAIKYLQLFSDILQDVMIYFFVFICCELVKNL